LIWGKKQVWTIALCKVSMTWNLKKLMCFWIFHVIFICICLYQNFRRHRMTHFCIISSSGYLWW
jgi:hypothetical protein